MHPEIERALRLVSKNSWDSEQLYLNWWSGLATQGKFAATPGKSHQPILSKFIAIENEFEIHSILTRVVGVSPGEFFDLDETRSLIIRKMSWSNHYWNWHQTSVLRRYPHKRQVRIYIPSSKLDLPNTNMILYNLFESSNVAATLKFRREHGIYADATVIWIDESEISRVLSLIKNILPKEDFIKLPPPLARNIDGLGVADNPLNGESFGWLICKIIWTGSKIGEKESINSMLKEFHIDLERPWLINRSKSDFNWSNEI